jgi:sulfate/thiosulfate transport system permease protein
VLYLSLIVLIPTSALFFKTFTLTWAQFWVAVTSPHVPASYLLIFGASLFAALVNLVFGLLLAWDFTKVILPQIMPALPTGFAMAFARAIGEYGSVIFIAGNMPMVGDHIAHHHRQARSVRLCRRQCSGCGDAGA